MGFFFIYIEVFPIGISLRVRIRGTRSDGKLNFIYNISNKNFKAIALIIAKDLAKVASYYFINKIILKGLKESIIVVLYKEGKKTILS